MSRVAVIDTNVVVAGLLTGRADSPVARVLDGMLAASFAYVLSETLLREYRQVLLRPAMRRTHGLKPGEVDALLEELVRHAIVFDPPRAAARAPDPGDPHLWDLLAARDELILVTGDKRLLAAAAMRGRTRLPAEFLRGLA